MSQWGLIYPEDHTLLLWLWAIELSFLNWWRLQVRGNSQGDVLLDQGTAAWLTSTQGDMG